MNSRLFISGTAWLIMLLTAQNSFAQIITTIAGTGTAGYNGDNIAATAAQFNGLQGLAVDAYGNIFVADISNHRIRKITNGTGIITTIAGTGVGGYNGDNIAATAAQINIPSALAFDVNGDLYFTDRSNHRIRKITTGTGIITTVAGTGTAGFNADGIAATSAQLNNPNDVSFDAAGNLLIADWQNNRVRKVDKVTGLISTIAGTGTAGYNGDAIAATTAQINGPCGIITDYAGNIYIAEYGGARVRKIAIGTGLISTIAGTGSFGYNGDGIAATAAQLSGCAYIRFDAAENMYIGDGSNHRVRRITKTSGIISTVAGTGTVGYNGDGIAATTAQLNYPFCIYFDVVNCNMYIADYYNNRLRKVSGGFAGCPSPVAPGNLVSCQVLPPVTINASNYNAWVPVFDTAGKIAVMINANGNDLGQVTTSIYTKTGACREDQSKRLYLNRNITITPQNQPVSGNVSVRLYILKAELDSLRTALNSMGQPSGVASINEVDVFKNNDACLITGSAIALPLTASAGTYGTDFYLQVNVNSFSSFYFANKLLAQLLPVKLGAFSAKRMAGGNELRWEYSCNGPVQFVIEKSIDAINFTNVGTVSANTCSAPFYFTDHTSITATTYYRLKIIEPGVPVNYSSMVALNSAKPVGMQLTIHTNPTSRSVLQAELIAAKTGRIHLFVTDATGRLLFKKELAVQAGLNQVTIDQSSFASGNYWLYGFGNEGKTNMVHFVKQ